MPNAPKRRRFRGQRSGPTPMYDAHWAKVSKSYLAEHLWCVLCARQGKRVRSEVTDHIYPHGGDEDLFMCEDNWQALCRPCHDAKTGAGR